MTQPRDIQLLLEEMIFYAERGRRLVQGHTRDDLVAATDDLDLSLTRALELIGEAARGVPDELRSKYPNIPWSQWVGLRNILIHAYHRLDFDQIWNIGTQELEGLIANLHDIIAKEFPAP